MIRNAVGTVISRTIVTATTKRTIGRLCANRSTTGPPSSTIPTTSAIVITSSNGTAVKRTFPGSVSLDQDFPTTVTASRLAWRRTSPGEGAGEDRERAHSKVRERPADPATHAGAVPRRADEATRSLIHSPHDRIQAGHDRHRVRDQVTGHHHAD